MLAVFSEGISAVFFERAQPFGRNGFVQGGTGHADRAAHFRHGLPLVQQGLRPLLFHSLLHAGSSRRYPD
jgi:hypothetical protein